LLTLAAPPAGGNGESCLWAEALELARRGVPVFPCRPIDKTPLCPHGFKNASCDPDIVHRWWTDRPDALIGVPTGVKFDVLDVDNGRHADAEKWLQENQHRLPLTRTHITRSGGRHFLFAPTPGLRCSSSRLGPHVDIRADTATACADYRARTALAGHESRSRAQAVGRHYPRRRLGKRGRAQRKDILGRMSSRRDDARRIFESERRDCRCR
jgi:hypothetical protein